jgi:hypothetical protein
LRVDILMHGWGIHILEAMAFFFSWQDLRATPPHILEPG